MVPKALFLQTPTPATEPATGITHLQSVQGLAAPVKARLPANLVKQPGNSMPVAELAVWVLALQPQLPGARVAEQSNRLLPQLILAEAEAEAGRRKSFREITCLTPVPAAAASCASGCTRKRNNKLKGERLCTTL